MINRNEYIGELIGKYLRKELTEEDLRELEEWVNISPDNKKMLEEWNDSSTLMKRLSDWERIETGKQSVWPKVEISMHPAKKRTILSGWQWWKYAAAVVLLTGLSGVWLWLKQDNNESAKPGITVAPVTNDVAPGQVKAKLTLADGSTIVLDTISFGQLALQGNTKVLNKDGGLVYDSKLNSNNEVLYNTLTTAKGETYALTLADGSQVWLNSASSIRYPVAFTERERKVEITGEAYFEVSHLPASPVGRRAGTGKIPFKVFVNGMLVEVTGTSLNINAYSDERVIRTTLVEGSIKVTPAGSNKAEILEAGQQIQVADVNIVNVIKNANIDEAIAWKKGLFYFDRADITTVMKQLARWYNIEVVYEGTKPKQLFIGKIERSLNLSQVLKVLERTEVNFRIEGNKIIVIA